jgi:pimeloyl-ACP methyl ester carboxylesterase
MVEVLFNPITKIAIRPAMNAAADVAGMVYKKDPREIRLWFGDVMRSRPGIARMEIEEIMRHNTKDDLPNIKCPTLIMGGDYDLLAPARQSRVMHELIPGSELVIVPTGHAGKMFQSELYNPPILEFLAKNYPPVKAKKAAAQPKPAAKKKTAKKVVKKKVAPKKKVAKKQ